MWLEVERNGDQVERNEGNGDVSPELPFPAQVSGDRASDSCELRVDEISTSFLLGLQPDRIKVTGRRREFRPKPLH